MKSSETALPQHNQRDREVESSGSPGGDASGNAAALRHDAALGCDYQGYEFGATYPDSVCVEGFLFDADNCDSEGNLYEPIEEIPCPMCQRREAIEWWTGRNRALGVTVKQATKSARDRVTDIRQNRGLPR